MNIFDQYFIKYRFIRNGFIAIHEYYNDKKPGYILYGFKINNNKLYSREFFIKNPHPFITKNKWLVFSEAGKNQLRDEIFNQLKKETLKYKLCKD